MPSRLYVAIVPTLCSPDSQLPSPLQIVQQCQEDPEFKCHAVTHNRSAPRHLHPGKVAL